MLNLREIRRIIILVLIEGIEIATLVVLSHETDRFFLLHIKDVSLLLLRGR